MSAHDLQRKCLWPWWTELRNSVRVPRKVALNNSVQLSQLNTISHPQRFMTMAQSLCIRNIFLQSKSIPESCQTIPSRLRSSRPCPRSRSRCPPFRSPFSSVHSQREQDEGSSKRPPLYVIMWSILRVTDSADRTFRKGPPIHRIHRLRQAENAESR